MLTDGISSGPDDEVESNSHSLLGLASNVSGDHGERKGLCGPERQGDVVADEEADVLSRSLVRDRHEKNSTNERPVTISKATVTPELQYLRDTETQHDEEVLVGLLDEPHRGEQHNDDIETQDHGEELRLKHGEAEVLDDDVGKGTESGGGKSSAQGNEGVSPDLGVEETLDELLALELAVLHAGLVVAHTLDDFVLLLLCEALGPHGASHVC